MVSLLYMTPQGRKCALRLCGSDTIVFIRLIEVDEKKNHSPIILEEYQKQCSNCGRSFGPIYYEPKQKIA